MAGITHLFGVFSALVACLFAAVPMVYADDAPLFPGDTNLATPLAVELHLPLAKFLKVRPGEEDAEFQGELRMADGLILPVQISPRGKSRREHCDFPPIRLNLKKKQVDGTIFAGQNKLKLVTHCSNKLGKREYLATEMFVYRLLNLFTDKSFRVRALEITYFDTERERQEKHFGFLIEHKKHLAKRLGGEVFETTGLEFSQLDSAHAAFVGLFSYFIGNTDFSMRLGPGDACCHNAVPIQLGDHIFPVPYDFDATGVVNPPYSAPAPNLSIRKVTQRLYRGYCAHNEEVDQFIELFLSKREEVEALIREFDDIPGFRSDDVMSYSDKFYQVVENPQKVHSKIIKKCR